MQRPSSVWSRHLRASVVVLGVALGVFACARDTVTLGTGVNDEVFAPIDAGDGATDAGPGLCVATACPFPWATCPALDGTLPVYACGTDLNNDIDHCGACDVACKNPSPAYHVHMACSAGQCQAFCNEDHADCNGVPDDGCESSLLDDSKNCGSCGLQCPAGVACTHGKCGCPSGMTECNGRCVDLSSDDNNCGACETSCMETQPDDAGTVPPHMFFGCLGGQCKDLRCKQDVMEYWSDCNHDIEADGCEVDLRSDVENCGQCGNACDPGQQCFAQDSIVGCQCKQGQTLCPARGNVPQSCIDIENDPRNCGACGYACPFVPNAKAVCDRGRCGYECLPGTADCNGRDDDGCEVDLNKDPRNCGGCGAACDVAVGQPCVGGRCLMGECGGGTAR